MANFRLAASSRKHVSRGRSRSRCNRKETINQSVCIPSCIDNPRTPKRMNDTLDVTRPRLFPLTSKGTPGTRGRLQRFRDHPLRPLSRLRRSKPTTAGPSALSMGGRNNREDGLLRMEIPNSQSAFRAELPEDAY